MPGAIQKIALLAARLGASAALIFLVFFLGHIGLTQMHRTLSNVAGWPLAAAASCYLVAMLAAAYKWRELLREQGISLSLLRVLRLNYIAVFYNLILPGQESGNAVKAVLLGHASRKANKVWASVLVDQVVLALATALMTVVGLLLNPHLPGWPIWMGLACCFLVGSLLAQALFLNRRLSDPLDNWLRPLSRVLRLPWKRNGQAPAHAAEETLPGEWLAPLWDGLRSYQTTWRRLALVLLLSLVFEVAMIAVVYQFSLGLGIHVSFLNLAWVMTLVSIAQALPISLAGVGIRDSALVYFLGVLGVASTLALELSLSILALNVLMGLPGAVMQMVPDRALARQAQSASTAVSRWAGQIPLKVHTQQPLVLPRVSWPGVALLPRPLVGCQVPPR